MSAQVPPTPRHAECLQAIGRLTVNGSPPSLQQLADGLGIRSKSGVHNLLSEMKDRGLVDWTPRHAHSLRILRRQLGEPDLQQLSDAELLQVINRARAILAERKAAAFR